MIATLEDLLAFWFEPGGERRWFEADPAFDAQLRQRFTDLVLQAASGELAASVGEPRGALALCLALDQLPRNIWRRTPRAFAYDRLARNAASAALEAGHDRALAAQERLFVYLPFQHSEDLADQERSVRLFAELGDAELLDYAVRHRDIIARFGRFPHRNAILGRASTAEEIAFLREPGSRF